MDVGHVTMDQVRSRHCTAGPNKVDPQIFQASCQVVVMVVIPVVSTRTHVLCTLEPPLGEGTDRRTLRKNQVLVSRALLDWEIKASQDITAGKLHRFITPM